MPVCFPFFFSFSDVTAIHNLFKQLLSLPASFTVYYEQLYFFSCSSYCFYFWLPWFRYLRKTTAAPRQTTSPVLSTPCCDTPRGLHQLRKQLVNLQLYQNTLSAVLTFITSFPCRRECIKFASQNVYLDRTSAFLYGKQTFFYRFLNCKQDTLYFEAIDTLFYRCSALKFARWLNTELLDAEAISQSS